MIFKSEYPERLYRITNEGGISQAIFTSQYLPKLTEIKLSNEVEIEPNSGLILRKILAEEYLGFYLEDDPEVFE